MRSLLLLGAAATGALLTPTPASAWGKNGHLAICDLAYRNFTQTTRDQLKAMFSVDPSSTRAEGRVYSAFNYACLEEDENPRPHPNDHFINLPRNRLAITGPSCPSSTRSCILAGIDRDLGVLGSRSTPAQERARALMGIGHWVGDLHQPLHVSFQDDRGGNGIEATGACTKIKFHAVWDNCIIERRIFKRIQRNPSWSRFTITYRLVDRFRAMEAQDAALISQWRRTPPWQWAAESYAITLRPETGYCTLKAGECWYDATRKVLRRNDTKRTIDISADYLDRFEPVVEMRLRQAGYRLAHLINQALDPGYRG